MYCHNCGNQIIAGAKFCQSCGAKVEAIPEDPIAQKAEELELTEDMFVDNNALIEKSAKWSGTEPSQAKPPVITELPKPKQFKPKPRERTLFSYEFSSDAYIFPSLVEELNWNILLQKRGAELVCTEVEWQEEKEGISFQFSSPSIDDSTKIGISTCVHVKSESSQERRFQRSDIFKFFEEVENSDDFITYFVDFGEDCKTAARFFTVIAKTVFGYKKDDVIEFDTWSDIETISKTNISGIAIENKKYGDGKSKYWFTDYSGKILSDYYEYVSLEIHNGITIAQKDGKFGFIKLHKRDIRVENISPFTYDSIDKKASSVFLASQNDRYSLFDLEGRLIKQINAAPKYLDFKDCEDNYLLIKGIYKYQLVRNSEYLGEFQKWMEGGDNGGYVIIKDDKEQYYIYKGRTVTSLSTEDIKQIIKNEVRWNITELKKGESISTIILFIIGSLIFVAIEFALLYWISIVFATIFSSLLIVSLIWGIIAYNVDFSAIRVIKGLCLLYESGTIPPKKNLKKAIRLFERVSKRKGGNKKLTTEHLKVAKNPEAYPLYFSGERLTI